MGRHRRVKAPTLVSRRGRHRMPGRIAMLAFGLMGLVLMQGGLAG